MTWTRSSPSSGSPETSRQFDSRIKLLTKAIDAAFIGQRWDAEQYVAAATVWLEQVQVQCYFFLDIAIENDIDPRDLHSLADHQRVLDYAVAVSTLLDKEVIISEKNSPELVWIRVNGSTIEFEKPNFNA